MSTAGCRGTVGVLSRAEVWEVGGQSDEVRCRPSCCCFLANVASAVAASLDAHQVLLRLATDTAQSSSMSLPALHLTMAGGRLECVRLVLLCLARCFGMRSSFSFCIARAA